MGYTISLVHGVLSKERFASDGCMKQIFPFIICLGLVACSANPSRDRIFSITEAELRELKLSYYSDYYSFIGWDEKGMVAFAIDNNRGQDGDTWQADHFVVMYDELQGWLEVEGNGFYDNVNRELHNIPDSRFFTFKQGEGGGVVLKSEVNALELSVAPETQVIKNTVGISRYELGVAAATLVWRGRTLRGRVIHEYLFLPAFNRLARTYMGIFNDFHGIYAVVEGQHDLYLHRSYSDFLAPLTGRQEGFFASKDAAVNLHEMKFDATERELALGFYRWPRKWQGGFVVDKVKHEINLELHHRNNIANWIIGGFSMGIVRGSLKVNGVHREVVGIGELIM